MSLQQAYENVKNNNATIRDLISVICGRNKIEICIDSAYELSQHKKNRLIQKGFTHKEAQKIEAAFELMEISELDKEKPEIITCAIDTIELLKHIAFKPQEHLVVIALDTQNRVIDTATIFIGNANQTFAEPRDILRFAVQNGADSIIIAHSHPSHCMVPSEADLRITNNLEKACDCIHLSLRDHVIIGGNYYISLKEKGYM